MTIAAAVVAAGMAAPVGAAQLGTAAPGNVSVPQATLGTLVPVQVYEKSRIGVGGVGLRNRVSGGIEVSAGGVTGATHAYLYWAVITSAAPLDVHFKPTISRRSPSTSSTVTLNGKIIGTGSSPCWGGKQITVFKADVPISVAPGSGYYEVKFASTASGDTRGTDPWAVDAKFPLMEGASLVLIATGPRTVALYDTGLAGKTFVASSGLSYTLSMPRASNDLQFLSIGADGQSGQSRFARKSTASEVVTVNGRKLSGPGSDFNNSDWNGSAGTPLPQLWDNSIHQFTQASTNKMNVAITGGDDCLTPVANAATMF